MLKTVHFKHCNGIVIFPKGRKEETLQKSNHIFSQTIDSYVSPEETYKVLSLVFIDYRLARMSVYPNAIIINKDILYEDEEIRLSFPSSKNVFSEFMEFRGGVAVKRKLLWPDLNLAKAIKTFLCISGMNYRIRDQNDRPFMKRIRLNMQKLLIRSFSAKNININSICQGKS